jgi:hypothetical protein
MADEGLEKHLLAGMDERLRGFTRTVEIERREGVFRAIFRYEALVVESASSENAAAALAAMVTSLQERGYRQLRTRLNFVGGAYLGSQELWVEYPDPERPVEPEGRLVGLLRRIWEMLTGR